MRDFPRARAMLKCLILGILCLVFSLSGTDGFAIPGMIRRHVQSLHHMSTNDNDDTSMAAASIVEYDDFLPYPHADLQAIQVVEACMNTMLQRKEAGLEVCWNFSSDRCRASLGGSLDAFLKFSTNPVFSYLVHCNDYKTISIGPIIQGTPTRGDMQTVLIDVMANADNDNDESIRSGRTSGESTQARRFLWTLQKERRPPRQGCFLVHECIYVRNAYDLTL